MSIPPLEKKSTKQRISELSSAITSSADLDTKRRKVVEHINEVEGDPAWHIQPSFSQQPGADWFNVAAPLSFERQLRRKIVVLDFFTYCCINCMHVLPDLAQLERRFPEESGVVVVGVHSAKFTNEKQSGSVANAIARYGIRHAVVNDPGADLWGRLGVTCWPTLVVVAPGNTLLHYIIGEGHGEELMFFMEAAVDHYRDCGKLSFDAVGVDPSRGVIPASLLSYPGKLCCSKDGQTLFIADSSNHRILAVSRSTGAVQLVVGSGKAGLRDGTAGQAQFCSPQGVVWCGGRKGEGEGVLYVADTDNHCIRKVSLPAGGVSTVAGVGTQGRDKAGGRKGREQEISSPWDLALGRSPDANHEDLLYLAMAGTHQIWVHFLDNAKWFKGSELAAETTVKMSGSGEEENRNNSYPHKAGFAQPSGLALAPDGYLYVADSESSTIRAVSTANGSVKAVVGGAMDPLDLFAYGDVDGKGREARLQHPLGVAWSGPQSCLYVADSYNHKIKMVDPVKKTCTTLAGTGLPGLANGSFECAQFSEPGGLCMDPVTRETLFVADTNNHRIRVLDLNRKEVSEIEVVLYYCVVSDTCRRSEALLRVPLLPTDPPGSTHTRASLSYTPQASS